MKNFLRRTSMMREKLMVLGILLISLLCITAVSAAEDTTSDIASADNNQNIILEENINEDVSTSNEELILEETDENAIPNSNGDETKLTENPKSFTELNATINGNDDDTINLNDDYEFNPETDWQGDSGITINRSMSIYGNGITIDGANATRIFNITSGITVTIHDINFINAKVDGYGGAINGKCTVINCNFTNNKADNGGAILWNGNDGSIINCTFENNYAKNIGGAIAGNIANFTVSNCTFISNKAGYYGGAIGGNISDTTLADSTFKDNTGPYYGGALRWEGNNNSIKNCSFEGNNATYSGRGGAIHLIGKNESIQNCTFENNIASGYGSAICLQEDNNGSVTDCIFVKNGNEYAYGTICCYSSSNCYIENCSFENNSGSHSAGICAYNSNCDNGTIKNCTFINCDIRESYGIGSAIYWYGGKNTVVSNCTIINCSQIRDGAVYIYGKNCTLANCTFINITQSGDHGGAAHLSGDNDIVENCTFTNCSSEWGGGAIWISGSDVHMSNCNFTNNEGDKDHGGAIMWDSRGTISNCTFINNTAKTYNGGAVYVRSGYYAHISNSTFINNTAKGVGGAIYFGGGGNNIAENSSFINNTANESGGAIFTNDKAFYCSNTFINNTSLKQGGAIYNRNSNNGTFSNCTFISNNATEKGGAIFGSGANTTFTNNTFINNFANAGDTINWEGNNTKINYNILINNSDNQINLTEFEEANADYNWFGNNATNYQDAPSAPEGTFETWLFLNATVDPDTIQALSTSNIVFKLHLYNANSGDITEFSKDLLPEFNLTINATKGTVDKELAKIEDTIIFTGNSKGKATATGSLSTAQYTVELDIEILNTSMTATEVETNYNVNKDIVVTLKDENNNPVAGANITNDLDDKTYTTNESGQIAIPTIGLAVGTYTVKITYAGNDTYNESNATTTVKINQETTELIAVNLTTTYNDTDYLVVTLKDSQDNPLIGFDLSTSLSTEPYTTNESGQIAIPTKELMPGNYTLTITYAGNQNYIESSINVNITVNRINTELTATEVETTYKINADIIVTLKDAKGKPIAGAEIRTNLSEETYTTNESGQIAIPTKDLAAGTYKLNITYAGNEIYNETSTETTVTIKQETTELIASDLITTYNDTDYLVVTLKDGQGAPLEGMRITLDLIDEDYRTNESGQIKVPTKGLMPKTYTATIEFAGNENYKSSSKTVSIIVNKISTELTAADITATYNVGKNLVITLKDSAGNPISGAKLTVNLGSKKKCTTDKNGQVKINVAKLVPKTYTAKISFAGDDFYKSASASAKVIVKKAKPKITAKKKTFKQKTKVKKYTVTLKNNIGKVLKNKKLTLRVKGKTYKAKTNKKGKATFKIKNLKKKGKYTAVIKFKGDKYYKKVTKKVKLTVKKSKSSFKTIARGSKKTATVKKIQRALKNNGYYLSYKGRYLKVDGKYGVHTERGVKQFQKPRNLKVTGKVDEKTAKKLKII